MVRSLRRSAILVLTLTLSVNALNYLRDAVLAARFGAGPAADALFSALLLPAILQQMLVAGTLAPAVVPVYLELRGADIRQAGRLVRAVLVWVTLAMLPVVILGMVATPSLVGTLLPGFNAATQDLTVGALRFFLPGAVCLVLAGLTGALLNAHDRFALPALTPGLASVAALAVLLGVPGVSVTVVAAVMALAMVVQLALHLPPLIGAMGELPAASLPSAEAPEPSRRPLHRVLVLSLPLLAYVGLSQITTLVERVFASHLGEGAIARLTLAQKLSSLPLFLVAGSLTIVIFPRLAALAGDAPAFGSALQAGLQSAVPLLLLCTVWLVSGDHLLVTLLYQHGAFTPQDSAVTAQLLSGYALGLAPAGIGAVLLKALHARQDVRSPLWVIGGALAAYLVLAALLSRQLGAFGLALALSVTAVISTILLSLVLVRRHHVLAWRRTLETVARLLPATGAAWAVCTLAEQTLAGRLGGSWAALGVRLAVLGAAGGLVFLGVAVRCGVPFIDLQTLWRGSREAGLTWGGSSNVGTPKSDL